MILFNGIMNKISIRLIDTMYRSSVGRKEKKTCPCCGEETYHIGISGEEMESLISHPVEKKYLPPLSHCTIPTNLIPSYWKCKKCNLGTLRSSDGSVISTSKKIDGYDETHTIVILL